MEDTDHAEMDDRQMLAALRRDMPGRLPVLGVVCNAHVADLLKEELQSARKRWQQPVELLIDASLRCYQSEVYYTRHAWEERCEAQQRARALGRVSTT